jgi:hypothetical protein
MRLKILLIIICKFLMMMLLMKKELRNKRKGLNMKCLVTPPIFRILVFLLALRIIKMISSLFPGSTSKLSNNHHHPQMMLSSAKPMKYATSSSKMFSI